MRRRALIVSLATVLLAACSTTPPVVAPTLAGDWEPVIAELGGKDFPVAGFGGAILRLTADSYELGNDRGTYALLPGEPPARIDIRGVVGPNAGRTIAAIYERAGDRLTICYQLAPGDRPVVFRSDAGPRVLLVRYRRVS